MSGSYHYTLGERTYRFDSLAEVMAKATPARSGDRLAGVIADSAEERVVAQMVLAELPLKLFLEDLLVPYEDDEITRLIVDSHDREAFETISHFTVGDLRNWLLSDEASDEVLERLRPGITPEMAAAVCKVMQPGSDSRCTQMPRDQRFSQYDRSARPSVDTVAAQSSNR
ncbi:Ethanolamine ammonia-lyase large subunit protein [Salinisphaera shabanensis E1L3A]|uniref:Ethanolamine ammonia-lyase large subunit protein n=1 Tax=Salinisphaera shabanensis E1L3A TaxID=1033802 RepID=U2FPN5_9GAMM|nr:Ethanolamine ammonia-lyase large subunit protein [Salinisphaera shabanensis E1L3A]